MGGKFGLNRKNRIKSEREELMQIVGSQGCGENRENRKIELNRNMVELMGDAGIRKFGKNRRKSERIEKIRENSE